MIAKRRLLIGEHAPKLRQFVRHLLVRYGFRVEVLVLVLILLLFLYQAVDEPLAARHVLLDIGPRKASLESLANIGSQKSPQGANPLCVKMRRWRTCDEYLRRKTREAETGSRRKVIVRRIAPCSRDRQFVVGEQAFERPCIEGTERPGGCKGNGSVAGRVDTARNCAAHASHGDGVAVEVLLARSVEEEREHPRGSRVGAVGIFKEPVPSAESAEVMLTWCAVLGKMRTINLTCLSKLRLLPSQSRSELLA